MSDETKTAVERPADETAKANADAAVKDNETPAGRPKTIYFMIKDPFLLSRSIYAADKTGAVYLVANDLSLANIENQTKPFAAAVYEAFEKEKSAQTLFAYLAAYPERPFIVVGSNEMLGLLKNRFGENRNLKFIVKSLYLSRLEQILETLEVPETAPTPFEALKYEREREERNFDRERGDRDSQSGDD